MDEVKLKEALATIIDLASENQLDIDDFEEGADVLYEVARDQAKDMEIVLEFYSTL